MNILYTGFNGKNNSSKLLLDNLVEVNKLYLKNSFVTSVKDFEKKLTKNNYDLIISFGEAKLKVDTIKIELVGSGSRVYKSKYDYNSLLDALELNGYKVLISEDAGNYLCNNLYYNGLKYIDNNKLDTQMIFIHIPKIENISDFYGLAKIFKDFKY